MNNNNNNSKNKTRVIYNYIFEINSTSYES